MPKKLCFALDPGDSITLTDVLTWLNANVNKFATHCSWDFYNLTPLGLQIAEWLTFLIFLTNEWLNAWCKNTLATKAPQQLTCEWSLNSIGLGMLNSVDLFL